MPIDSARILLKKKKQLLETWMNSQLADESLREDLISNDELRANSEELLDILIPLLTDQNLEDVNSPVFEPVLELLSGISITRARQGFTPRETALYVFTLKEALLS